jgi:hypothetical protein
MIVRREHEEPRVRMRNQRWVKSKPCFACYAKVHGADERREMSIDVSIFDHIPMQSQPGIPLPEE